MPIVLPDSPNTPPPAETPPVAPPAALPSKVKHWVTTVAIILTAIIALNVLAWMMVEEAAR